MKTIKELLDFFGVEYNKIYRLKTNTEKEIGYFKIDNTNGNPIIKYSSDTKIIKKGGEKIYNILQLRHWDYEEYQEPMLDKEEYKYLSNIIKPFKERVIAIYKIKSTGKNKGYNYISIKVKSLSDPQLEEYTDLPLFEAGTMYKGIEENKPYTIEELGL